MGALLQQFMNKYPYTDFHELNADWLIKTLMEMINQVENFVSLNAIKYADPIQWNIVRQYEKNTVVIDPLTGTAYISVQPVPSGVALTRTEYWTVVFDLGSFVVRAAKNFSNRYEADTTLTATFSTTAGDWLVWGDTLYEALVNITAGDQYVIDSNIRHITVEEIADALAQAINSEVQTRQDADSALSDRIDDEVQARQDADSALSDRIDDEAVARLITGDFNYCENYFTYVDGVNGSDENDGLTSDTPFKTLEMALEKLNQRETSVVIRILTAGTYKCSKQVFNGITLHIIGVDNVIIDFSDQNRNARFYNCHVNFSCSDANGYLTLKNDYDSGMLSIYFENCASTFNRVQFTNHTTIFGGSLESTNCIYRALLLRGCNAWLANTTFNNDDITQSALQAYYSAVVTLTGTFTHGDTLPSAGLHGMIRIERSTLYNAIISTSDWQGASSMTYKYLYGLSGSISQLMLTREVYYELQNFSTSGENSHNYDAIINNENSYLPFQSTPLFQIPSGSDLNDYVNDGSYRTMTAAISATISNTPYTTSGFRLDVIHLSNQYHILQILRGVNDDTTYLRHLVYSGGTWSIRDWAKYVNSDEIDATLLPIKNIQANDDLNDYLTHGYYRAAGTAVATTLSNCPYTSSGFRMTVKQLGSNIHGAQIIEGVNDTTGFYRRTFTISGGVGSFNPWVHIEGT